MKRLHWHWTGGRYEPNSVELKSYHRLIGGDGRVHEGAHPISANIPPLHRGAYAAHTRNANSYAIGIAICCMFGARERPFEFGDYPPTEEQVEQLVYLSARLGRDYGIPVTPTTMLTHAEVQRNLRIPQDGKWDICVLPGDTYVRDADKIGGELRARVSAAMRPPRRWWWL